MKVYSNPQLAPWLGKTCLAFLSVAPLEINHQPFWRTMPVHRTIIAFFQPQLCKNALLLFMRNSHLFLSVILSQQGKKSPSPVISENEKIINI